MGKSVISKMTWKLMPFLGMLYLIAYIDRQNVSYAKLDMVGTLGMSGYAYGLGASLFFIGYFLFGVPNNLFLDRFGTRTLFARILVTWGMVTVALAYFSAIAPIFFPTAGLTVAGLLVIMTARITARRTAREETSLA